MIIKFTLLLFLMVSCQSRLPTAFNFLSSKQTLSIMQGPTSESEAVMNVVIPVNHEYRITAISLSKEAQNPIIINERLTKRSHSQFAVLNFNVKKLQLDTDYELSVEILKDKKIIERDVRKFRALNHNNNNPRLILASCLNDSMTKISKQIWAVVEKQNADAIFLTGDMVYADLVKGEFVNRPAPKITLWDRYIETRLAVDLYFQKELKPVYAIWDDHDVGQNDADTTYEHIDEAKAVYAAFFPLNNSAIDKGPGFSFRTDFGPHHFYFLDDRSFRVNTSKNKRHLGYEQTQWLMTNLSNANGVQWQILGNQFFGGYSPYESFETSHPEEFKEYLKSLKALNKKYVFLSGDRHLYELMRVSKEEVGHATYELTSSAIHAIIFPGTLQKRPNVRRIDGRDDIYHFVLLDIKSENNFQYQVITEKGLIAVSKSLNI